MNEAEAAAGRGPGGHEERGKPVCSALHRGEPLPFSSLLLHRPLSPEYICFDTDCPDLYPVVFHALVFLVYMDKNPRQCSWPTGLHSKHVRRC